MQKRQWTPSSDLCWRFTCVREGVPSDVGLLGSLVRGFCHAFLLSLQLALASGAPAPLWCSVERYVALECNDFRFLRLGSF